MSSRRRLGLHDTLLLMPLALQDHTTALDGSPLSGWASQAPWGLTQALESVLLLLLPSLGEGWQMQGAHALHHSAVIEPGASIKGPAVIGPRAFVSSSALLRGGVWLGEGCIVGPGCELKTSVLGAGSKLAHLNFCGDSVIGADVNVEAGAMIANYRNEREDKRICVRIDGVLHTLQVTKFGALVGDGCRIGANAVLAPGTVLAASTVVGRLALVDQERG
jgi:UDP-N-acetylglucosamine diphosphorylase / glucose-1-phosphate thymidylyltransferase / UDP-N-acetylgalactosamine diphosphorylase / glucosamine-1-phosphate N-acetyltransferase / galactosamine-1-phosphate N-acetyltransferase